jgi:hypothetical protein
MKHQTAAKAGYGASMRDERLETVAPLLRPARLWTREEVLARPSPVPAAAGICAWYFTALPSRWTPRAVWRSTGGGCCMSDLPQATPSQPHPSQESRARSFQASVKSRHGVLHRPTVLHRPSCGGRPVQ